jgi:CheY-like chemotaxis protein
VVGIAATEKTAVELAKKHSPHLVLADIQLRGSDSGISAVNQIMKSMSVPVIFVTGFPERLLTGKQVEPAFVISKPFDPDLLRAAIAQALDTVSI